MPESHEPGRKKRVLFVLDSLADISTLKPVIGALSPSLEPVVVVNDHLSPGAMRSNIVSRRFGSFGEYNVKRVVRAINPQAIVIANLTSILPRAFVWTGDSWGIPIILVPHGIMDKLPGAKGVLFAAKYYSQTPTFFRDLLVLAATGVVLKMVPLIIRDIAKVYGDPTIRSITTCAPGESVRDFLINIGASDVVLTGSPEFDILSITQKSHSRNARRVVTLLTQPFVEDGLWSTQHRELFLRTIVEAVASFGNTDLVIKVHPREQMVYYESLLRSISNSNLSVSKNEVSLVQVLDSSDVVIGVNSTAMLGAMILDKPVIVANLINRGVFTRVFDSETVISCNDLSELKDAIADCFARGERSSKASEKARIFAHKNAAYVGTASRRIAEVIEQRIRSANSQVRAARELYDAIQNGIKT